MSSAAYAGLSGPGLESSARAGSGDPRDLLRVDISAFDSLSLNSGSAMISFNGGATQILINRESDTDFFAMDPHCTHAGCIVPPYSIASNDITCPCHGSKYDIHGHRLSGPAVGDLLPYASQFDGVSTLSIELPGFTHRINQISVESSAPGTVRMRLSFPAIAGGQYRIRHAAALADPFVIASFAITAVGPADKTVLNGTGATASVWVDSANTTGFYVLDLLVFQTA